MSQPPESAALVGTFRLLSMESYDEEGNVSKGFVENPDGFITYTAEGYMMALLSRADRPPFADGDIRAGSPQERAEAFLASSSFAGRYEVKDGKVFHYLEAASFPNWKGTTQARDYELTDTHLTLYPPKLLMEGRLQSSRVHFEKLQHWT